MTTYRRVKVSTLIKRHLPYCPNCQMFKETLGPFALPRLDGYQPKSRNISRECLDNTLGQFDEYYYRNGAGCPNFKELKP